jgi:hypothetical protein
MELVHGWGEMVESSRDRVLQEVAWIQLARTESSVKLANTAMQLQIKIMQ